MAVIRELLRVEENGTLSFGNYEKTEKTKLADFPFQGDLYKVKTFREITKLERNGMLVYESDPGSTVTGFSQTGSEVSFMVEAEKDVQVILGLEEDTDYQVYLDGEDNGIMKTSVGGKLVLSLATGSVGLVRVRGVKR